MTVEKPLPVRTSSVVAQTTYSIAKPVKRTVFIQKNWEPSEQTFIVTQVNIRGKKWRAIARLLAQHPPYRNVRSANSVRCEYDRLMAGRVKQANDEGKNLCAYCDKKKIGHICGQKMHTVVGGEAHNVALAVAGMARLANA